MKKIQEIIKPFMSVIFGTLLLLFYLDWLKGEDEDLVIGIFALVLSIYYIASGLIQAILVDKLPEQARKGFGIANVVAFPAFMFLYFLLIIVMQQKDVLGPSGWIISIYSMVVSILLPAFYLVAFLSKDKMIKRLAQLSAMLFVLALLLNILFDDGGMMMGGVYGTPVALGAINLVRMIIFVAFSEMLFAALPALMEEVPVEKEEPAPASAPVEAEPVEEEPAPVPVEEEEEPAPTPVEE